MKKVKIFAPATIANLGSGFDLLGLAIDGIGDEIDFLQTEKKEVVISEIKGFPLSYDIKENIVGYVADLMLKDADADFGVDIKLLKGIKPGSGIGSSAASSSGAAFGINKLLGDHFSNAQLIEFAMEGEKLVSGEKFADNVAPCLLGGMVLINEYEPLSYIELPVPENIYAVVIHPQIEIRTKDAREILPIEVNMKDAIRQAKNLATLISGLYTSDFEKIGIGLEDRLATPYRRTLIPHYETLMKIGDRLQVIGSGISGSGPSIFYLCRGKELAENLAAQVDEFYSTLNIEYKIYTSAVARKGVRIIN